MSSSRLIVSRDIFQRYRAERRVQPYLGFKLEWLPDLSRYLPEIDGAGGFVVFANVDEESIAQTIENQIEYFARIGRVFEWKVYEFDRPADLKQRLERRGFSAGDEEAFLVLNPEHWSASTRLPAGVHIKRITEPSQLNDFVAAEEAIWSESLSWHREQYARDLTTNPNGISIYCAYEGQRPIGTGRVSFSPRSAFAELNGGGVIASMRGRGIFSALLACRIEEARARGYRWVAVDAPR